ncbi:hypothetical protein BO99DRAFT_444609 [Aspergillus violaceofuscus CBS 115571]|uniref:LysR family regulatory protein n=1 Tax=Aspergillus violaceofuscus (strain CBS 115571) TaxID=1450538 RepID=A0A2V5H634_ASPV1|nr:hypothetical protein BO99DRAFT_444609 [Aspergillus violaceofuscus CBS 115571]
MFGLCSSSEPAQPARVPTDTVIPLNAADDTEVLRSVCVVLSYRFDDVLDPEKLRSSFERLLDRPGWRKIGARLRLNKNGRLEYHIPEYYDAKRPIVNYSHASYETSILNHPLGSRLPRPSVKPAVVADPTEFDSLTTSADAPKTLHDYLTRDVPQLSLHIASFSDSTLISISLPHTLTDGTGGAQIYRSWALVLQGREDEIPAFHGYAHDPLASFGTDPQSATRYMYAGRQLTGWRKYLFIAHQLYDGWRYRTGSRIVCIPGAYLATLRQRAITEIRTSTGDETAFVSDNDVITAWFTRLTLSALYPRTSTRTMRIMNAFTLSTVLGDSHLPTSKAFISNAATEIYTFLQVKDFFTRPLSYAAHAIRQSMTTGGTREQVEALQCVKRQTFATEGHSWPIFGDTSMEMMSYSNWTKGKYFETDFSAAIVCEGLPAAQRAEKPGFASMVQFNAWSTKFDLRNLMPIMGKDAAGNYWMQGPLREVVWRGIERELAQMG